MNYSIEKRNLAHSHISAALNSATQTLTLHHSDGRINSALNEEEVIDFLVKNASLNEALLQEKLFLKKSDAREWFDMGLFSIHDNSLVEPFNIKITDFSNGAADNLNCKLGIYYALTGGIPSFNNSIGWDNFFKKLSTAFNENKKPSASDYSFLVINKESSHLEDHFFMGLRNVSSLVANGNNLPFQCKWGSNRKPIYRTFEESRKFLLSSLYESVKLRAKIKNEFESHLNPYI